MIALIYDMYYDCNISLLLLLQRLLLSLWLALLLFLYCYLNTIIMLLHFVVMLSILLHVVIITSMNIIITMFSSGAPASAWRGPARDLYFNVN